MTDLFDWNSQFKTDIEGIKFQTVYRNIPLYVHNKSTPV